MDETATATGVSILEPAAEAHPVRRLPPNAGKGRVAGVPNKTTTEVKRALVYAFEGMGGAAKLQEWASANPGEFYRLWAKLLPTEVSGPDGAPIKLGVELRWGGVVIPL